MRGFLLGVLLLAGCGGEEKEQTARGHAEYRVKSVCADTRTFYYRIDVAPVPNTQDAYALAVTMPGHQWAFQPGRQENQVFDHAVELGHVPFTVTVDTWGFHDPPAPGNPPDAHSETTITDAPECP
jgi:hypothetical protein